MKNKIKKKLWRQNTEKNGFVAATKLGTTHEIFAGATKNFAAATKVLLREHIICR